MVGIKVIQPDSSCTNSVPSTPVVNPTLCGAVPWAIVLSGVRRPLRKVPAMLSYWAILDVSIACRLPAAQTFLQIKYSMSAMSKLLGCVAARWVTLSVSSAVISRLKPKSSLTFRATSFKFETPVPNWRKVMSFVSCPHTIGAGSAAAATAAPPAFSMDRRE